MSKWRLGTMGFSYKDWSGPFYPDYIPPREYLAYYSQFFNAVEIDSTFYGTPRPETVRRWAEVVPEDFHFCAKLPKEITHEAKLFGAADRLESFLEVMRLLGDKLAVLLVQLPPSFTALERPALENFLEMLPKDLRFAVEVRDRSWHTEETAGLLSAHSVAWAATEYEDLPRRIEKTAPFVYVRFIGRHGRFETHERERLDVDPQLEWWRENLLAVEESVETIYGFFNNDYAGFGVGTCSRFKQMLGLPVEPFNPPQQPRLFD
jgi:uncharacterized protein YecE (DUF72 family)